MRTRTIGTVALAAAGLALAGCANYGMGQQQASAAPASTAGMTGANNALSSSATSGAAMTGQSLYRPGATANGTASTGSGQMIAPNMTANGMSNSAALGNGGTGMAGTASASGQNCQNFAPFYATVAHAGTVRLGNAQMVSGSNAVILGPNVQVTPSPADQANATVYTLNPRNASQDILIASSQNLNRGENVYVQGNTCGHASLQVVQPNS